MPDNENTAPHARHNIDCYIWDFLNLRESYAGTRRAVGSARVRGVTPTGQRRAGRSPRDRSRVLYRVADAATVACVLGIIVLLGFLLYNWLLV